MRLSQRKGDIGVTQAIASFTKMGYDVSIPVTESAAYDVVVDNGKLLARVQVKYSGDKNKEVDLRLIHSNSKGYVVKKTSKHAYDWLYILCSNGDEYLIKECLSGRRSVRPSASQKLITMAEREGFEPSRELAPS
ncbi:hypothetical protein KC951_04275 [Candidatus Saccharibacteria bacterium]|nr:hypothetical protein [Candidatus Saccharibacteria bacterium]